MWLADEGDDEDDDSLRQGDLLAGVAFPAFDTPPVLDDQGRLQIGGKVRDAIAVGQCCTIENQRVVALAPVMTLKERKQSEDQLAALRQAEPPPEGGPFLNRHMLLETHPQMGAKPGELKVADLTRIVTYTGKDHSWLHGSRVARMTVEARRLLRIRLSLFFGRAEEQDEMALRVLGLPPGMHSPPPNPY